MQVLHLYTYSLVPPAGVSAGVAPLLGAALDSGKWVNMFNWLNDRFNLFNRFPDQYDVGGRLLILLCERSRVVRWESSVMFCDTSMMLL